MNSNLSSTVTRIEVIIAHLTFNLKLWEAEKVLTRLVIHSSSSYSLIIHQKLQLSFAR